MKQYSVRAQFPRKSQTPISPYRRAEILSRDQHTCGYCGFDATTVDHIVPYSYGGSDEPDNLIACCSLCNSILGSRIFPTMTAKRQFIRERYGPYLADRVRRYRKQLSICADCGHIYQPHHQNATNVLCAQCNLDDQSWEPGDPRRREKRLARDQFTADEHNRLIAAGQLLIQPDQKI